MNYGWWSVNMQLVVSTAEISGGASLKCTERLGGEHYEQETISERRRSVSKRYDDDASTCTS